MKQITPKKTITKWQSVKSRLPLLARTAKVSKKAKPKARQQRSWNFPLSPTLRLIVQLKTVKPKHRTKKQITRRRQLRFAALLILVGFTGLAYFGLSAREVKSQPIYVPPAPLTTQGEPVPLGDKVLPTTLSIPDIGVNTSVIVLGKQADGTLGVPSSPDVAGWYGLGPTPGEAGPSVIVGHINSPKGPAVFRRLDELKPSQLIEVKRADGTTATFTVTEVKQFEQNNFPTQVVYGEVDHAALRLITCGGSFNRTTQSYSHNTVVFATLVR